jgi:DNA-binding HxlR family transcriptional regulator
VIAEVSPIFSGLAIGLAVSGVVLGALSLKYIRLLLEAILDENLKSAALLETFQKEGTQKVEEQNMTALTERLNRLEEQGIIRKDDEA